MKRELMANGVGCTLAHELEQLSRQIAQTQTEGKTIEATVERALSALRSIERQAMVEEHGMSDEELPVRPRSTTNSRRNCERGLGLRPAPRCSWTNCSTECCPQRH